MSKARKILDEIHTGPQYRTTQNAEMMKGTRQVRHMIENCSKRLKQFNSPSHKSANPADHDSKTLIGECINDLSFVAEKIKKIKESKKPFKG